MKYVFRYIKRFVLTWEQGTITEGYLAQDLRKNLCDHRK